MSEAIAIHARVQIDAKLLTFDWVGSPGEIAPPGGITLARGYLYPTNPLPLRHAITQGIAVFPIPKFGFVQGPLLDPDITIDFMLDMQELLFKYGFIALWDPFITDRDAQEIVRLAISK